MREVEVDEVEAIDLDLDLDDNIRIQSSCDDEFERVGVGVVDVVNEDDGLPY